MPRFSSFESFLDASAKLFLEFPDITRYSHTTRITQKKIVLKVTNDKVVLLFKTDQANELRFTEKLNILFSRLMSAPVPTIDLLNVDDEPAAPVQAPSKKKK